MEVACPQSVLILLQYQITEFMAITDEGPVTFELHPFSMETVAIFGVQPILHCAPIADMAVS